MSSRTLARILPLLFLVSAAGFTDAAGQARNAAVDADGIRAEAKKLRQEYLDLEREVRSRQLLKGLRPRGREESLRAFYDKQYGFRLNPRFQDLTLPELRVKIREVETEMQVREMRYGGDDVHDVYLEPPDAPNPLVPFVEVGEIEELSSAVVAIVNEGALTEAGDGWELAVTPLVAVKSGSFSFCPFDRFYEALAADLAGTGFLVGEDLVATAGHVVRKDESGTQNFLDSVYFVFDYVERGPGEPVTHYTDDQVYRGVEVLMDPTQLRSDWAVIRLDRPVTDRTPMSARHTGRVPDDANLSMIGHPLGMPQKYAVNARVLDNETCGSFYATLDVYNLNSGSPVINAADDRVEGLVVADVEDFEEVCDCLATGTYEHEEGRPGARVTRATEFMRFLDLPDAVRVTCVIPAGTVIIDTDTTHFVEGDTLAFPVPELGMRLVRGFDTCHYAYTPLPGDLWQIAYLAGTDEVVMELVCFP